MKYFLPVALVFFLATALTQAQITKTPTKSRADYAEYGGRASIGFAIGGAIGVPFRIYLHQQAVLDAGIYVSGVRGRNLATGQQEFKPGIMFGSGFTAFGNPYFKSITRKTGTEVKLRRAGIGLRYNYMIGDYAFSRTTLGFVQETVKSTRVKKSFVFELGVAFIKSHSDLITDIRPIGLHWRFNWNGILQKG